MTNLDSIFKSRDITLPTKVHLVRAMVLPVVMYGYESWTIKKAEHQRIDAFELWCWRRLLRVPWTARSNQSILKEISPEYSLEGLKDELVGWHHRLDGQEFEQAPEVGDGQGSLACCSPWGSQRVRYDSATELTDRYHMFIQSSVNGHLV